VVVAQPSTSSASASGSAASTAAAGSSGLCLTTPGGVQLAEPNAAALYLAGEQDRRSLWSGAHSSALRVAGPRSLDNSHTPCRACNHACSNTAGSSALRPSAPQQQIAVDRWLHWEAGQLRPAVLSGSAGQALPELAAALGSSSYLTGPGLSIADVSVWASVSRCAGARRPACMADRSLPSRVLCVPANQASPVRACHIGMCVCVCVCVQVCVYCTLLPLQEAGGQLPAAVAAFMQRVAGEAAVKAGTEQVRAACRVSGVGTGCVLAVAVSQVSCRAHVPPCGLPAP
jgi:hypothetical protein